MSEVLTINRDKYDVAAPDTSVKLPEGLSEDIIRKISKDKNEPAWMLQHRLHCFKLFQKFAMPTWGPDLSKLDLNKITFYAKPDAKPNSRSWDDVPEDIKKTFDRLGIPEAERNSLAGVGAQYESQVVYHKLKKELEDQGVIFLDMDVALHKHPKLVKEHFMKCVPPSLHKFAALHGAVWSGGTFLYIPKGVKVEAPLQAYFRMNAARMGQFEHTLIIVEEGAQVHYLEGCSAPVYEEASLHAGCVEVFVKAGARARYSSVENWSKNTYNLNTKRAIVDENAIMEWVNGNLGSGITMLYPCTVLKGDNSKCENLGIAFANKDQNQDTGMKIYHLGKNTKSTIVSKSISKEGGITSYRGLIKIAPGAKNAKANVQCDALMADNKSQSITLPHMEILEPQSETEHEATVSRIQDDQVYYLMSRGLSKQHATQLIVSGFIEPIVKNLPVEYAVELNRLIEMEMEDTLG
ncbi:MAG: Fe-S cluster assembly protein SufB [Candidatus Woesearchaeota archaeon]|jgi:Fe-S cluster assembly protein SufB|nr:Fe-S cluster assembly protein SufB [Candidatus Woesearchaeota archaeon]MDP7181093.1 Fe-S cluster assembly protein SufB [Candidatus Woesearchaeota archaeon]MDP7198286.1 Fe-S cluster assembly protein SufB [Candidatus Woesearchaeota archaeon]MDP7467388.1 Fe-S cluster assembly protein SufB [Candidatus Woesearchaeota archaeon]MDP7647615.1 Fe-S cluster assembly protein SufB [Candidatus Woesearchaeota archaeon]